ncbi:MAG: Lipopolysaccharide heptosyltransferase [Thermoleophilia bacterium]|nr:Lipopolysaccharide heptosyltransferase [Thermoleophilia bacterium]MCZ4495982.1 Lipopolysaccharide heptosyltransferase [Thermoleophilia bacterium]
MTAQSWDTARRVLCVRLDSFGDVLMTGPAMEALRDAVPGRTITLLTSPSGAQAASVMPVFDDVICYEAPWMKHSAQRSRGDIDRAFIEQLAAARFDAACICTVSSQTPFPAALACLLADIPLRLAHVREQGYQLLTHAVPEPEPAQDVRHEVQRQLDLVATVGAPAAARPIHVDVNEEDRRAVAMELTARGLAMAPLVVLHPGASAPSRRYPAARYAAAAEQLVADGVPLLVVGGDTDRPVVDALQAAAGVELPTWVGSLSTGVLAALLERADVVIANNSGPAHLASALGTPIVSLYAMTNPQHTPWMVQHDVLQHDVPCRWCRRSECPELHHRCLTGVEPAQVVEAVRGRLRALGIRVPTTSRGLTCVS